MTFCAIDSNCNMEVLQLFFTAYSSALVAVEVYTGPNDQISCQRVLLTGKVLGYFRRSSYKKKTHIGILYGLHGANATRK